MATGDFYPAKQIGPYKLWIGSRVDSLNRVAAQRHDVGLIVKCTRDIPFSVPGVKRVRVPVDDIPDDAAVMLAHIPKAVRAIDETLRHGKAVLVHCHAGISRSASVVAAFLMAREGLSPTQAIARIRRAKPETFRPNANFQVALDTWHATLRRSPRQETLGMSGSMRTSHVRQ